MITLNDIKGPYLLMKRQGKIRFLKGKFRHLKSMAELHKLHSSAPGKIVFITPFCVARKNGMDVRGNEPILSIEVKEEKVVPLSHIHSLTKGVTTRFQEEFRPILSDAEFAQGVRKIQKEEIGEGNACQVVYSRKFEGLLNNLSPLAPLALFKRLLKQQGSAMTFVFSDGKGRTFVGASPERQLEIREGHVIKNPLAGTIPKGSKADFKDRLNTFLEDRKECNELSQILDEELKIMAKICPKGGKILGPFLREAGAVIHTEYHLVGQSNQPSLKSLQDSFHAPTLVGSPLESAFRIIAKREKESRRYYGGEIGVLEKNGDLFSAILIRTAEIFADGRVVIQAGAGIVRDSKPENEAKETLAKASSLIGAFKNDAAVTTKFLTQKITQCVQPMLCRRNKAFSSFHFEDQAQETEGDDALNLAVTIINNEDNFAQLLAHMTRNMGYKTKIVDTFDFKPSADNADIVILGPGPGDINDESNDRMCRLLEITQYLLKNKQSILGVCLGMQSIATALGIPVAKQAIPTQGVQREIDFFGIPEKVGFYNSFSPLNKNIPLSLKHVSVDENGRLTAFKNDYLFGVQFHVESAMTQNGYQILQRALTHLSRTKNIQSSRLEAFIKQSIAGDLSTVEQKAFLLSLNRKGYTAMDVATLVQVLQEQMPARVTMPNAIDICGTGGSGLPRINTSTISAFVLSACDVPIAKHGNKAASGRFGSFDLLENMGIKIDLCPDGLESIFKKERLAFIYARQFHPSMKHFAEVRRAIGKKTIFNLLGPLLNPANAERQVIGVSDPADMKLIIEAAKLLGKRHVVVVHGTDGLDEATLTGESSIMELKDGRISRYTLHPEDFGFETVDFEEIASAIPERNIAIAEGILGNQCKTQHLNLVLANCALALRMLSRVDDLKQGVKMAHAAIRQGLAQKKLEEYRRLSHIPDRLNEIIENKKIAFRQIKRQLPLKTIKLQLKKSNRSFKKALSGKKSLSLIAEIKQASPSNSSIYCGQSFEPAQIAKIYEENGADAISVLTESKYFKGSLHHLKQVHQATKKTPILMKDFVIDPYQIYLARHCGADAVLLIVALLDLKQLKRFIKIAHALKMDVLVEVHNAKELEIALQTSAQIIGINNRNLHTFEVDPKHVLRLLPMIPKDRVVVAESGYDTRNIAFVNGVCDAALVGTTLMQQEDIGQAVRIFKTPYPLLKICGVTNEATARYCEAQKVSMIGLNFVPKSKRFVTLEQARMLRKILNAPLIVGVFQNQAFAQVNAIAKELDLDYVQLSGDESAEYCAAIDRPVIKTIGLDQNPGTLRLYEEHVAYFIVDGKQPGSGKTYDYALINKIDCKIPFLVAGGITPETAQSVYQRVEKVAGVDVASGVETNDLKDPIKIQTLIHNLYATV